MTQFSRIILTRLSPLVFVLAVAGCGRGQIKVEQVPKEGDQTGAMPAIAQTAAPDMAANPHAGMNMMGMGGAGAQPQVKWKLPSGWKEKEPSQMRVGSFDAGKEGQAADVSIVPLQMPSGAKMELDNYNLWREGIQLAPVDKVESQPVAIGSEQGKLYEVADSKSPKHILAAVLEKNGVSWYFKMNGDDAVVKEQKQPFLDFLKSISFESAPVAAVANPQAGMSMPAMGAMNSGPEEAAVKPAAPGTPLPEGWKELAPSQFILAKYVIHGSGDAKAEMTVSSGIGGGVVLNANRWRGQLGLAPMTEEEFSKQTQTVDVAGQKGTLVDITGTDKSGKKSRLVGVIVEANSPWFYKLMGDPQIVEQQKEAFTKFIQTAKFGN
jgi:hypothetical protein